jgi:DNA-binding LacI/PurR family transcriptional regulator
VKRAAQGGSARFKRRHHSHRRRRATTRQVRAGDRARCSGILLDRPQRPTAILCFSDVVAYGVVQAALARGLDVPGDLSVVGFDDNPLAQRMRPSLTTVRQDVAARATPRRPH